MDLHSRISGEIYPDVNRSATIEPIDRELLAAHDQLLDLADMLEKHTIDRHYIHAMEGLCMGGLNGLSLMMVSSLVAAALLTILVCVDSHTWIYLSKRYLIENQSFISFHLNHFSPVQQNECRR